MSLIYKEGQYYGKGGSEMPAEDMAEVASPLPSVMSRLPILFDESGAERIVGWYKYSDGTKKPVYEKTVSGTTPSTATEATQTVYTFSSDFEIKNFYGNASGIPLNHYINNSYKLATAISSNTIKQATYGFLNLAWVITLQYTKSTDTPV